MVWAGFLSAAVRSAEFVIEKDSILEGGIVKQEYVSASGGDCHTGGFTVLDTLTNPKRFVRQIFL